MAITEYGTKELAKIPVSKMQDVLLARMIAREEAGRIGFAAQTLTQIATIVSELTRNVVQHAGAAGTFQAFEAVSGTRTGLLIVVEDGGSGIADINRVLEGTAPGAGIPGCRKLADDFTIRSTSNVGTCVRALKWATAG